MRSFIINDYTNLSSSTNIIRAIKSGEMGG
jgi:hypothetical protein